MFALLNYVTMTNIFWAFVEGLFLISRISIAVFSSSTPYWLFYIIGWGELDTMFLFSLYNPTNATNRPYIGYDVFVKCLTKIIIIAVYYD